jgi:myo-inositol-1(or 4)-monophosphatase
MNLLNLAARVCNAFTTHTSQEIRTIQKVKDNQCRDVVTELDIKLHNISEEFVTQRLPGCKFLSEESIHSGTHPYEWLTGEWLLVDPLDGSNNHALGLPNYGYMAAHLLNAQIQGSVIILPEHNQYIVLQGSESLYAQPVPLNPSSEHGTVYYAYPPKQDTNARNARNALQELIDTHSAGMYRYGSACAGLYQLLCGRHMAFVGHGIRFWDAIAFFPILTSRKIQVMYTLQGNELTLLASTRSNFLESAAQILERQQGLSFSNFNNDALKVEAP